MKKISRDRIFASLTSKQITMIMSSVSITEQRQRHFNFTNPYLLVYQSLIILEGDKISYLKELEGKTAGGLRLAQQLLSEPYQMPK